MKKKVKKMLEWFYEDSDRGEQNISEMKDIYTLVEKLQYRMEDLENEHMLVLKELGKIQADCMLEVGEELGFKIPTPGSYDIGRNWLDTH